MFHHSKTDRLSLPVAPHETCRRHYGYRVRRKRDHREKRHGGWMRPLLPEPVPFPGVL